MTNTLSFSLEVSNSCALYRASLSPLARSEEHELGIKAKNGDKKAQETLFRANLRFAIKQAGNYRGIGIDDEDLYSVAASGLWDAVLHYAPDRGASVCTCASRYIANSIFDTANKCGSRQHLKDEENRMLVQIKSMMKKVQSYCDDSSEQLNEVSACTGIPVEKIQDILYCSEFSVSANKRSDETGLEVLDKLYDCKSTSPEEKAIVSCMRDEVLRLLPKMEKYERYVYMLANGVGYKNAIPHSLADIGKRFGHSKQWANWKLNQAKKHLAQKMQDWA